MDVLEASPDDLFNLGNDHRHPTSLLGEKKKNSPCFTAIDLTADRYSRGGQ